eukprot:scaffold15048_cov55-Attheya_sp.AAC.2
MKKQHHSGPAKSEFKNCLQHVPVPKILLEGVNVIKVNTNGKTRKGFITLSEDKFTLYLTSSKVKSSSSSSLMRPILKKVTSIGSSSSASEEQDAERAIDIGSIDRIQRGQNTHKFEMARQRNTGSGSGSVGSPRGGGSFRSSSKKNTFDLDPNRSFSIIFRGERTLDLMTMPTEEGNNERDQILNALDAILKTYQTAKMQVGNDVLLLRYIWLDVDKDKSNSINATELGVILDRINFYMKKSVLNASYEHFGKIIHLDRSTRKKGLSFEQCATFLHKLKRDTWQVKPVNLIWNKLFGEYMRNGKQRQSVSDITFLQKFLHKKQGETNATIEQVRELFARLNTLEIAHVAAQDEPQDGNCIRIDKNRFEAYLISRENDVFDPNKERLDSRSMNKPLSEYWINTSHNTYLKGDQLTSQSSVEMYMHALYRGCRSVELDIWDGERDTYDQTPIPIVYHGHTMTTKLPFADIIKCIKVFMNFNPDSYPIILSFENHCTLPFQEAMAEQLTSILGPIFLRGMIVVKGRRPNGALDDDYDSDDTDDEESTINADSSITESTIKDASPQKKVRQSIVASQLAKLTLLHGTAFKAFEESQTFPAHYMHSFGESKMRKLCRYGKGRSWVSYNQKNMSRIYPSGKRVDSSNYSPVLPWAAGCQMVALNFQTPDVHLRVNDGRFRENGHCGYVQKPSALMMKDDSVTQPSSVLLSVRILSGSCLPKPRHNTKGECIDPYVKVSVHDVSMNEDKDTVKTFNTSMVPSNGFFPIWNSDFFSFTVENGLVAMLQLNVFDYDVAKADNFIASASIPISCMRTGIRSVQLFDSSNTTSGAFDFASLLIEVKMKQDLFDI